jgi:hypothetical protein
VLNQLSKTIPRIRTGNWNWLCEPFLKRVRKNRHDEISHTCGWCGRFRISRTHILVLVFLRCMHPKLEKARKEIWERLDQDFKIKKHPTSGGQVSGKSKSEKSLADCIMATGVCVLGNGLRGDETDRCPWRRMMDDDENHSCDQV